MPPRRIAQHFDVAVVGSATGGLVAAALLAKAGFRVVTLSPPPVAPPFGTPPVYVPSQAVAVRRVLERLGLLWARHPAARRPSPRQLLLEHRRVDVPYGEQAAQQALAAEWPGMRGAIKAFFERLHRLNELCERVVAEQSHLLCPTGWHQVAMPFRLRRSRRFGSPFDAITLDALCGGLLPGHPVRDALCAPLAALAQRTALVSYFAAVRALHRYWCEEPWTLGEDHSPFAALWNAALAHNGQFWPQAAGSVQVTSKRRIGEIATEDSSQVATAQVVLWNGSAAQKAPSFANEPAAPGEPSHRAAARPPPPGAAFAVSGEAARLPVGLATQASVMTSSGATRAWRLTRPEPQEAKSAQAVLVARALGPKAHEASADEVRRIVEEVAPYLSDECEIRPLPAVAEAPGVPWEAHLEGAGPLGIQPQRMRTPFFNVLNTQDTVAPVLGVEGAFWVGWCAAEEVERRLRPRRPILKRWQPRFGAGF